MERLPLGPTGTTPVEAAEASKVVPLYTWRAMGLPPGVTVELPSTTAGAAADGKTRLVADEEADAEADAGVLC